METKNTNGVKAIAFDLGKVLFDFDYNIALKKIKDKINVSSEDIIHALFYENFADDFEKGLVSGHDFYLAFKKKTGLILDYQDFVDIWSDIFTLNNDTYNLIKSLKPLYKLFLISNINELHYQFLKNRFPQVFSIFDEEILSFRVKHTKPSSYIYDFLLAKAGLSKDELIYIDDRADLIQEARKQGFSCIRFKDIGQCRAELKSLGCCKF